MLNQLPSELNRHWFERYVCFGFLLLCGLLQGSVMYYFEPMLVHSQIVRFIVFDSLFCLVLLWYYFRFTLSSERMRWNKPLFFTFFLLLYLFFSAVIKGLVGENETAFILRGAHTFIYAIIIFLFVWAVGIRASLRAQFILFHGALLGTVVTIAMAYIIFPTGQDFFYGRDNLGLDISGLTVLYSHKVKVVPYLMSYLAAYYMWAMLHAKSFRAYILFFVVVVGLLLISIMTNMRSAIVGVIEGIMIAVLVTSALKMTALKLMKMLAFFMAGIFSLVVVWGLFFSQDMWMQSQIADKMKHGVASQDGNRLDGMLQAFGLTQDDSVEGYGYGMGAGYERRGGLLKRMNPPDSGFYHIYVTHGLLFVYIISGILLFSCIRMFKAVVRTRNHPDHQFVVANFAAIIMLFLSHFNDSPWVVIADVSNAALVMAVTLHYTKRTKK